MIRIAPQPEPQTFDAQVRQPGMAWIQANGLSPNAPMPGVYPAGKKQGKRLKTKDAPPHWRECLGELYDAYGGVCAYLGMWFFKSSGAGSVDHFIPKRLGNADTIYEWSNYRLASIGANRRKGIKYILDPFTISNGTFEIDFFTGKVYPAQTRGPIATRAKHTIRVLRLNDSACCEDRQKYYDDYTNGDISKNRLQRDSPFIYAEMYRQGLL